MSTSVKMVALELLDVVPPIMRTIKMKWKKGTIFGVTNLQFKILGYLEKKPGACLQDIAEDRALPIQTIFTAVEDLASRQLVLQERPGEELSKITFSITVDGQKILHDIHEKSRTDLEEHLAPLTADERTQVLRALKLMGPLFIANKEPDDNIEIQKDLWKAHG